MNAQVKNCSQLLAFSFLVLLLTPMPSLMKNAEVPIVICTAMGAKTVYVPASSPMGKVYREHCPLCLFFANSPLCVLVMKLLS